MSFNCRLKELRKSRKLTQVQLAKEIGMTERQYQRLEANDSKPMYENLIALADYFDVPMDFLLGRGVFKNWGEIMENKDSILCALSKYVSLPFSHLTEYDLIHLFHLLFARIDINENTISLYPTIPLDSLKKLDLSTDMSAEKKTIVLHQE